MKVRNLKPLSPFAFFFALACERLVIKRHSIESRCYRTGKYPVCRRVRTSFSPEIVQAGALKGLSILWAAAAVVGKIVKVGTKTTGENYFLEVLQRLNAALTRNRDEI